MNIKHIKRFLEEVGGSEEGSMVNFYLDNGTLVSDFIAYKCNKRQQYTINIDDKSIKDFIENEQVADVYIDNFVEISKVASE